MNVYLILVADQARARLFKSVGRASALTEIQGLVDPQARLREQDLVSDASGGNPHDIGHHGEAHAHMADDFAKVVCQTLDNALKEHKSARILVAAPPHFLGALRKHMSNEIQRRIVMEIAKDLTMFSPDKIRSHLPEFE